MSSKSIICWQPNQRAGWVLCRGLICWQPWDSQVESIGLAWLSIDSLDGKRVTKGVLGPKDISPNTRSLSVFFTERRWGCLKSASGGKAFLTSFPSLSDIPSLFSLFLPLYLGFFAGKGNCGMRGKLEIISRDLCIGKTPPRGHMLHCWEAPRHHPPTFGILTKEVGQRLKTPHQQTLYVWSTFCCFSMH